ncbi:MAG: glycosyltransferase family 39 protein [Roseiflexaceae bacterium]
MSSCVRRNFYAEVSAPEGAQQHAPQRRRAWFVDTLILAALITTIIFAATWVAQPRLRTQVAANDSNRTLVGFWPAEQNGVDTFRWSRTDSALRLFGFEQQAAVVLRLRLTAVRDLGQPPALLTVGATEQLPPIVIQPIAWRRYSFILPVPERGDEAPLLTLHTSPANFANESRDLGIVLSSVEAIQYPFTPAQRLPGAGRLAFLVLLGLLIHTALRRFGIPPMVALAATILLAGALGVAIARVPGQVAYWLPNMWFACALSWLALALAPLMRVLRRPSMPLPKLMPLGLCALVAAQVLLPIDQPWSSAAGWPLLLVGGMLLVAGLSPLEPLAALRLRSRIPVLAVFAGSLLVLAWRLYGLDQLPVGMWRDEARHGLLALRILHDPQFRPVYVPGVADIPALLFYLDAVPIGLFGPHPWTVRLVPALAGALTPLALYWMVVPLFGRRAALLSAGLMAASVWHNALSRLGFAATLGPPLTILALGLIWRALQPGSSQRRYMQAGLAGAICGLAVYAYHPSRLAPLVVALAAAIILGRDLRAWRMAAARLAIAAFFMLLVLLPLINYGLNDPEGYTERLDQTSIFNPDASAGHAPARRVEQNVRLILGMWNQHGDENARHNLSGAPMLDPLTGAAFVIGVGIVLLRLRERRAWLVLVWLGLMLVPALMSNQEPHAVRTVEVIAPSMVLAGVGATALLSWALELRHWRHNQRLGWALAGGLLLCVLVLNTWRYFVTWPSTTGAYHEFYVADTHIGEVVQRLASSPDSPAIGYQIFLPQARGANEVLDYLTYGINVRSFVKGQATATQCGEALLFAYGIQPATDMQQARRVLGPSAMIIGAGPRSPLDGQPEFVIYGCDATARPFVARALDRDAAINVTMLEQ